ncbi:Putative phosphatidate phosphatase [Papilio machaon]|uniref:Putative phosphatidate phosphatase n=1 Tax=Papilio machaon TaxID=76193 RepID=A0A194QYS9_PAPMA|nr:Putative phosphatidate phosphatase [Papilio machaon]
MDRDSRLIIRKILLDFLILFCIGFMILAFYLWGDPYKRGFFCDDESLKHPYKDSTVTNVMLYIVGLGVPVFTMVLTEWIRLRDYKGGRSRNVLGRELPAWLWEVYKVVGVFLFGCACQQLTTDVAKYTIGRLRPHFFNGPIETARALASTITLSINPLSVLRPLLSSCVADKDPRSPFQSTNTLKPEDIPV